LIATTLFIVGILIVIILNPILTYANKTTHNNFSIFHNKPLDSALLLQLDQANEFLKKSECYNPGLKLEICLNDGSVYTKIIEKTGGGAFGRGFYNKVVLLGTANYKANYVELNGYKWNLTQLLAHEMVHCLQLDKFGLWKSRPVANIPTWKWEGYAEYIARQNSDQKNLSKNIARLIDAEKKDRNIWQINFSDSTICPTEYYNYWVLVQYCIDIKKMTFTQILADTTKEITIKKEMMDWHQLQKE
jgi:hypothetical protein